jgi:RNA polymerase sigma-70 factor, ECF subfamily
MSDDPQNDRALRERLLAHDPIAAEQAASTYLPSVRRHLVSRAFARGIIDEALINDATVEAVLDYIRHPQKFDPSKSSLATYLNQASWRDLLNALAKDRRQRRGWELTEDVELAIIKRNKESEVERIKVEAQTGAGRTSDFDRILTHVTSARDRKLLQMMRDGEKRTSAFAAVLGIGELTLTEQKRAVKQHKDRLKQWLKRTGKKYVV